MYKAIDKWLIPYLRAPRLHDGDIEGPRHLLFCVADHYEPFRGGASRETGLQLVERWCRDYPSRFGQYADSSGRSPRHTFFYPCEEYDRECLTLLGELCGGGHGEVEVQLHHRNDTAESLARQLVEFRERLAETHGLLGRDRSGAARYGFVHGNWALCNSRPDGDWCGVDEELSVLRETGCFADFTFPSVPSPTQPRRVNSIYYARDERGRRRGHDRGRPVSAAATTEPADDELMLIQGPLALNWRWRKWGLVPRIENGEITASNMLTPQRIDLGLRQGISVAGRPDWVVLKIHTHGCHDGVMEFVLGQGMQRVHEHLHAGYNDGAAWQLHYVSARELYNVMRAAEAGERGNPAEFLNYEIESPEMR